MRRTVPKKTVVCALGAGLLALHAHALQNCTVDDQPVNPNNGATTAGKTGLMRCRDADTGLLVREQALRDGRFTGLVRHYKAGQLEREYAVDDRGNRSGLYREWDVGPDGRRTLIREETDRNSSAVGLVRTWFPTGERRRLSFNGDDARELASVEFDTEGRLRDLRCGPRPLLGTDFDDRTACGHAGGVSTVVLLGSRGEPVTRIGFERGERRTVESLGPGGAVRERREASDTGSVLQRYSADGATRLFEARWVVVPSTTREPTARPRSVKVLEQEFHASGQLIHETRWTPPTDDRDGVELASESHWYLNGQPKDRSEYRTVAVAAAVATSTTPSARRPPTVETADAVGAADAAPPRRIRVDTQYHDNGRPSFEGSWALGRAGGGRVDRSERPIGTHRQFDEAGRLRAESVYDDRGRITRERAFDESGAPTRDDEVFEDGSRKSLSR